MFGFIHNISIIAKVDGWSETLEKNESKKVTTFLEGGRHELQTLLEKVKFIEKYHLKVMDYLDPTVRQYCQVANIIENRLVMIVANSSVATQLRFETFELLRKFKEDNLLKKIREIQYKVRPYTFYISRFDPPPAKGIAPLSEETATLVLNIAESLEDAGLRDVMKRIASHTKK